jgi:amino acid transporter
MADAPAPAPTPTAPSGDEAILASFGYKQELRRTLKQFSLYAVSFSIISITTGITLNYAFAINNFGPAGIWTWLIAGLGQLFLAFIIAELGTRIPLAGYAYQWGARLVNSTYGWFVGFIGLGYLAVGGAGITLLATAPLTATLFGWNAGNPRLVLFIAYVLLILPAIVNVISVQLAARVNNVAVFTEILGMVGFGIALFFAWAVKGHARGVDHGIGFLTQHGTVTPLWYGFALAGLIGIFTIVGFELAADLSEEAVNARVTVPKAVVWSVVSSIVLGFIALVGFTIAMPDVKSPDLIGTVGFWFGTFWTKVFLALVVSSIFALTVVGTAAQARLVYSLARDNMLPFSKTLRKVNAQTQTPIVAMVVMFFVGAGFLQYGYLAGGGASGAFGALIGATSILPFIVYLMIVVAYMMRRKELETLPGAFNLGQWATPVMVITLIWVLIALGVVTLPHVFRKADYVSGGVIAVAALWYFVVLQGRLRRGEAGVDLITTQAPKA